MEANAVSVRKFIVDKNATEQTAALFYNLKKKSETLYLVGIHENPTLFVHAAGVSEALYGTDFMFLTDIIKNPGNSYYTKKHTEIRDLIKSNYRSGRVITMCWHFRNPIVGETASFYWKNLIATNPNQAEIVPRLIPGGDNNELFKQYLDVVANFAKTLIDDNGDYIPVIFRPWHEQDGDWFWWGKGHASKEEYVALWRFTVEYLRDVKNVHNFLYAYSPGGDTDKAKYLEWFPGDEYVDILGMDHYLQDKADILTKPKAKIETLCSIAEEKNKIAAITETGYSTSEYPVNPTVFSDVFIPMINIQKIAYLMFWSGNQYIPTEAYPDFLIFVNNSRAVFYNDLLNMYTFAK